MLMIKDAYGFLKKAQTYYLATADGEWIRVSGTLAEDDRAEARKHMLDSYPELRKMYDENDGNTVVWYFKDAEAIVSSFVKTPEKVKF